VPDNTGLQNSPWLLWLHCGSK